SRPENISTGRIFSTTLSCQPPEAKLNCPPVMHRPPPRFATQLSIHCRCFSEYDSRETLLRMMQSNAESSATVSGNPRSPAKFVALPARFRSVEPGNEYKTTHSMSASSESDSCNSDQGPC